MLRPAALLPLMLLAAGAAHAQGTYNGSLYSRFGLGERIPSASSQAAAMGGGGTALTSLSYAQVANPASLGNQVLTRVTMGAYVQGLSMKDASDASANRSEGLFGGVEFAFPLVRQKLGVGLRFTPDTRLAYGVRQTGRLLLPGNPTGDDTLRYRVRTEGSGGLNHLDLGVGRAFGKRLLVGASAGALFGVLDDGRRTTFVNAAGANLSNYDEQNVVTSTRLAGFSATAGVLARFDSLGGSGRGLHLGATVTLPTRLSGRRTLTLGESLDRDTLTTSQRGTVHVPLGASIGAAYYANPKLTLIADARYEPWSSFKSDFGFAGYGAAGSCTGNVCTATSRSTGSTTARGCRRAPSTCPPATASSRASGSAWPTAPAPITTTAT